MKSSVVTGLVLVTALAGLGSCSRDTPSDDPSSVTPDSSPTSSTETTPPSSEPPSSPTSAKWEPVREWKRGEKDSFGLATDELVLLLPTPTGPATGSVQTMDGEVLLEHELPGPTWGVQDGYLSGDFAVYTNVDPAARELQIDAYRISTGDAVDTSATESGRLGPETDVNDGRLAFAIGTPGKGMCLHLLDLNSEKDTTAVCEGKGVQLGDLALSGDTLAYSTLTMSGSDERCKSVQFVDVSDGQGGEHDTAAEDAALATGKCGNWSPSPLTTGAMAWDNADPNVSLPSSHLFAFEDDQTIDLGVAYTDSARACGDWLFWTREGQQGQFSEILGWRAGMAEPMVALPEEKDVELTTPDCADGRWLTTRADNISGKNETLTLRTLDTQSLP